MLAGNSEAAGGDHRAAYPRYQQQMSGFVEQNQQIALANAKRFTPGTRTQIWLQNQTIKALPYLPWKNLILNLATKGVREAASAITLNDYPVSSTRSRPSAFADHP